MTTLLDLYNKRSEAEKDKSKKQCEAMYSQAVACHNGAVLGILPLYWKMQGVEGVIKEAIE